MPDSFDITLNRRAIPHARTNLAEQILETILYTKQGDETLTLRNFWRSFTDLFLLPQPALVFACILMIGLTLGISYAQDVQDNDLATKEFSSFITADNGFSGGAL